MASFKPEEIRALESGGNGVSAHAWLLMCIPRKDKHLHVIKISCSDFLHPPNQARSPLHRLP